MRRYSLHGLVIDSSHPLAGVPAMESGRAADVVVRFGARPAEADGWSESVERPVHTSESAGGAAPVLVADRPHHDETLRLRYAEGIRFHVSPRGDAVWCDWVAPLTEADAVSYLLGPVIGVVLRRRGVLALHASAVVIAGGAWALLGPGGSGKSTLAAAFAYAGFPVLTDDILALRREGEAWIVLPAHHGIRLWEDSARLVAEEGSAFPEISPTWPKRDLDLARHELPIAHAPVPLRGVLVLEDYGALGVPPALEPLKPSGLLVELVANVYVNYLASSDELAGELGELRALAFRVPGWKLWPGAGVSGLRSTVEQVVSVAERGE